MFAVSAIASLLFLGGWHTGVGAETWLMGPILSVFGMTTNAGFGRFLMNLFAIKVMLIKGSLLVFVQIWVRWTLPRLRIDQVMTTCLKYLVPISCVLFLGATLWPLVLASTLGRTTIMEGPMSPPLGEKVLRTVAVPSTHNHAPQLAARPAEENSR